MIDFERFLEIIAENMIFREEYIPEDIIDDEGADSCEDELVEIIRGELDLTLITEDITEEFTIEAFEDNNFLEEFIEILKDEVSLKRVLKIEPVISFSDDILILLCRV